MQCYENDNMVKLARIHVSFVCFLAITCTVNIDEEDEAPYCTLCGLSGKEKLYESLGKPISAWRSLVP